MLHCPRNGATVGLTGAYSCPFLSSKGSGLAVRTKMLRCPRNGATVDFTGAYSWSFLSS
jgi:hypothetical protein